MTDSKKAVYRSTPAGILEITCAGSSVTSIRFMPSDGVYDLTGQSAPADRAASQIREYMDGERGTPDFPVSAEGTPFQKKIWDRLSRIPFGKTVSYGQIAADIGSPRAGRAVGLACNRNPLPIIVPCHRVVGADGSLTGYAGGLELKKRLLELEGAVHKGRKI